MSSSRAEARPLRAVNVKVSRQGLAVDLADGRTLVVPIGWYPRLLHGTPDERNHWRLIGGGEGIHWPDLDEDVSVDDLLAGYPSGEGQSSLERWLARRKKAATKKTARQKTAAPSAGAGKVSDRSVPRKCAPVIASSIGRQGKRSGRR